MYQGSYVTVKVHKQRLSGNLPRASQPPVPTSPARRPAPHGQPQGPEDL